MNENLKTLAMIDVAEVLLKSQPTPMTIQQLIQGVAEIKSISLDDIDKLTQLYMDITQSAKFVYCGDDQWDLKERNLELWDKDGFAFVHAEEIEEDVEEDLDFTEFILEDEEEEVVEVEDEEDVEVEDEEIKEEKAYIEIDLPIKSTDDDDVDDDPEVEFDSEDYDEDDYNEIMDDYEDMYDE
ncbi:MAG: DNA-directed RNA polymerase subunit delta [Acholeplasmataceae bacterium]|nr:DNA-directed RNA polymerase subunit delta [Acholeplasmataceae bacterium]